MEESYTINDFTTEDWWFRPPHDGSYGIDFDALVKIHQATGDQIDQVLNTDDGFWFAVHKHPVHGAISVYVYEASSYGMKVPQLAEPMIKVIGTTHGGVQETQGTPSSTGNLVLFSQALLAVDRYFSDRGWE